MKVWELREALKGIDDDDLVVVKMDCEEEQHPAMHVETRWFHSQFDGNYRTFMIEF